MKMDPFSISLRFGPDAFSGFCDIFLQNPLSLHTLQTLLTILNNHFLPTNRDQKIFLVLTALQALVGEGSVVKLDLNLQAYHEFGTNDEEVTLFFDRKKVDGWISFPCGEGMECADLHQFLFG